MYETAFGLERRPFSVTPDAACCFAPEPVEEALARMAHRVEEGQGISVLTAPAGLGKTLLCRRLIQELAGKFTVAYLSSASFASRRALLQAILYEVGQRYSGLGEQELRLELRSFLRRMAAAHQAMALIVDEAHLLNDRLLEEIRLLANVSENGVTPVRVVLVGQLALEETLAAPAQAAISQLISCQVCLEPLTHQESREYLEYRVSWAGGNAATLFSPESLTAIAQASGGLPRCLNQLADHSLLLAFVHESPRVELSHVEDALADLKQLPLHWNEPLVRGRSEVPPVAAVETEPNPAPMENAFSIEIGGGTLPPPPAQEIPVPEVPSVARRALSFTDPVDSEAIVSFPSHVSDPSPLAGIETGWRSAGGIVPLTVGQRRPLHLIEEEVVIDRYAQIDSGMTETLAWPQADRSQTLARADKSLLDQELVRARPDRILEDDVIPLIDEALAEEQDISGSAIGDDSLSLEDYREEAEPLEDRLEGEVFDICREVQHSILEGIEDAAIDEPVEAPLPLFDAVEPDMEGVNPLPQRIQHIDPPRTAGEAVPKPNYKLIFSTLRKKLGRK